MNLIIKSYLGVTENELNHDIQCRRHINTSDIVILQAGCD